MEKLIAEFIYRLFSKSPKLFIWLQWIIGVLVAILSFLTYAESNDLFDLPTWLEGHTTGNNIIVSILMYILAKLPVENTNLLRAKVNSFTE